MSLYTAAVRPLLFAFDAETAPPVGRGFVGGLGRD